MKKSMKKILSLVLVVMMCVSVAVPAFATETAATCPGIDKDHFKTNCTYTKIDTYEPKCTERGYTVYQCDGCGKYFADDFVLNTEEHDYDVTKEATCTEKGTEVCSKCNDERDIPALGHDWTPDATNCQDPEDLIHQECTRCDAERDVSAEGIHTWKIKVVKEPACGKDGLAVYTCTVCEYSKDVVIDYDTAAEAPDHKWEFVEAEEMICKEGEEKEGNTAGYKCALCDVAAELEQIITVVGEDGASKQVTIDETNHYEVIEVKHDFAGGEPTYIGETCTTPAYKITVCTKCEFTKMEVIEDRPATGHAWTWDPDEDNWETTLCKINDNGVFVPGKTVVSGTCGNCGANGSQTRYHKYSENVPEEDNTSFKIVVTKNDATCMVGAYTEYDCEICLHFETAKGKPNPEAHDYEVTAGEGTAPTCTTAGKGYRVCKNEGCDVGMEFVDIPALGHSYMKRDENGNLVKDENGNLVYDLDKAVRNCATGKYEYTCEHATCPVEKTPANAETGAGEYTEIVDIPNYDNQDKTCHKSWDPELNAWTGTKTLERDNGCGKDAIWKYTCECGVVIYEIVKNGHRIPEVTNLSNYVAPLAPKCNTSGSYEAFECAACHVWCYIKAGVIVEVGTSTEIAAKEAADANYVRPWVIPATGCNIVIDKVFIAPTCNKPGQSAKWHCENEGCDAPVWYDPEYFEIYDDGENTCVKVTDKSAETAKKLKGSSAESVKLTTKHVFVSAEKELGAPISADRTCSDYGYTRQDCKYCDAWKWINYLPASGHDIYTKEVECTVNGYEICTNTWCEYRDAETNALVYDSEKNPTYKFFKSEGHKDAEGNPIICVADDFWCAECHPEPEEDSEPDPTYVKLKWYESHNTAGGDWVEIVEKYGEELHRGGMIPTDLRGLKDCTVWTYLLYVCPDCEDDAKGGYFNEEHKPCTEHVYTAETEDGTVEYSLSKNNLKDIPATAYTKVVKAPTFAEAGLKGVPCDCDWCDVPVATIPYLEDKIGFDISIDSGVYAGAELVNSGKMKVTVLVNAWQVALFSLDFKLSYNDEHFEYVGFELPEGSPFGESGVYAAAKDEKVEVYMANYGKTLTNIDLNLQGTQKAVIVLVFDIKDNANATEDTLGTSSGTLALNEINVLKANGDRVLVKEERLEAEEEVVNIKKYSDFDDAYIIKALGNVTGGVIQNAEKVIDDFDALNWLDLFIKGEYSAAADINKNGQLDGQDYEHLCTYIVDGMTYADLCKK